MLASFGGVVPDPLDAHKFGARLNWAQLVPVQDPNGGGAGRDKLCPGVGAMPNGTLLELVAPPTGSFNAARQRGPRASSSRPQWSCLHIQGGLIEGGTRHAKFLLGLVPDPSGPPGGLMA